MSNNRRRIDVFAIRHTCQLSAIQQLQIDSSDASALLHAPAREPGLYFAPMPRSLHHTIGPFKWFIAAFAAFAAWRIVSVNLAEHFASEGLGVQAGWWIAEHPNAYFNEAQQHIESDPQRAIALLQRATELDRTDGMSYALLGALWEKAGDSERARSAIDAAVRLAPAKVDVRLIAAEFELGRNDLAAALRHWSVALERRPALRTSMYPDLLQLADQPATRAALGTLLSEPVAWWPSFVSFAANKGERLETVAALYSLSESGSVNALRGPALAAVLRRLQRDGLWLDSRLAWLNSLPAEQMEGMGNVFNGGFELPLSGVGFDWVNSKVGHVLVDTLPTQGASGDRALNVVFRGPRVRYRHLSQYLMLEPGQYALRGRVRADGLEAKPGVAWTISCVGAKERQIGITDHFAGRSAWRPFETAFTVPRTDCAAQVVRLQLGGQVALDFEAKGPIWFDDIVIERVDGK